MAPSRKGFRAPVRSAGAARAAASAVSEETGSALGFIPADPADKRLTVDGAVCGSDGKIDIEAYEDIMQNWAGEPPPEKHPDPARPGVRSGEDVPKGLRMWDDVRAGGTAGGKSKDGAGWVAVKTAERGLRKREKWFNIRTCGSWRLAYLLARLQRALWEREDLPPVVAAGLSPQDKNTPPKKLKRQPSSPSKRLLKRRASDENTPSKRAKLSRKASAEGGEGATKEAAPEKPAEGAPTELTAAQKRMALMKERIAARAKAAA